MPLDFRYHLASLTAVFCALVLGMLIGVAMKEGPGLTNQIQELREEFQRSQALREIDERTERFNEKTQGMLVQGRLLGRNVVIVKNPVAMPGDGVESVRRTLEFAGANITAEITLRPALLQLSAEDVTNLYQTLGISVPNRPGVEDLMRRLALDLGRGWTAVTPMLVKQKLIRIDGDIAVPISTVVFLGGTSITHGDAVDTVDVPFLRGCVERDLRVAATEVFASERSAISNYRKVVPLTIDNVDRAAGRIALVLALSGDLHGHFGYKNTADDVAPDLEEQQ